MSKLSIDLVTIEQECNLSISCCILISDILLIEYTCIKYMTILNEELCQFIHNQIRVLIIKMRDVVNRVLRLGFSNMSTIERILRYCVILDDVRELLRRSLLSSFSSMNLLSVVLLISNLLRMIRVCIEDLYSSLVTTFDKHTKFID